MTPFIAKIPGIPGPPPKNKHVDPLFSLPAEGRVTLQIPDIEVDFSNRTSSRSDFSAYPKDWFVKLNNNIPAVGKQDGFTHWTKKGWEANKDKIKDAFLKTSTPRGYTWEDFEKHASEHFASVQKKTERKIKDLSSKLDALKDMLERVND